MESESPVPPQPKRPRIAINKGQTVEADPLAFGENLATKMARPIINNDSPYIFEIWFDRHMHDRQQHGDGIVKREGIGNDEVLSLLENALAHLVYYSLNVPAFSVIGFDKRVCFKKLSKEGLEPLNIIVQIHDKDIVNRIYEITVVTAMCTNQFRLKDGQYAIIINDDGTSILQQLTRGNLKNICNN